MLRITVERPAKDKKLLFLEGKIFQEWVKELQTEIEKSMQEGKKVILDFSKVSYIDQEAAQMINQFPAQKVEKRNCSLFIRTMLEKNRGDK